MAVDILSEVGCSLKAANSQDLETLFHFVREYYCFEGISFNDDRIRAGLEILLADNDLGRAWIIRSDARSVGYVILTFGFDLEFGGFTATVTDLYLSEDNRRRGFGTKALRVVERECSELGIPTLELQVERHNEGAQRFYAQLGFARHDRIPHHKNIQIAWEAFEAEKD